MAITKPNNIRKDFRSQRGVVRGRVAILAYVKAPMTFTAIAVASIALLLLTILLRRPRVRGEHIRGGRTGTRNEPSTAQGASVHSRSATGS